jgi:hypothetical protein
MSEFEDIDSAINYREVCPLCFSLLNPSINNLIVDNNIIFKLDNSKDKLLIDIKTKVAKIDSKLKYYGGHSYFHFIKECLNCSSYRFGIQFVIYVMNSVCYVDKLILGSEYLLIDDEDKNLHEITNKYSISETHRYIHYVDGNKSKLQKMPLIKFNNNPKEFLNKINQFSIFS